MMLKRYATKVTTCSTTDSGQSLVSTYTGEFGRPADMAITTQRVLLHLLCAQTAKQRRHTPVRE